MNNNNTDTLTTDTANLFVKLVTEHNNIWGTEWFYTPQMTKQERGNYTDLVKKGLIETDVDDLCKFTAAGLAYAEAAGQPVDTEAW
jgi:hypothetical protein